jgi:hypothetical protein
VGESGCCAAPIYRPWVRAFRASFRADAPAVAMCLCTGFRRSEAAVEDGLRSHPGYPLWMFVRILAAWPMMLFSRPAGALPRGDRPIAIAGANGCVVCGKRTLATVDGACCASAEFP